jgi:hypothetical protein
MLELLAGFVALVALLSISYFRGRSKKEDALSTALSSPAEVVRLYLRHAPEMDAYWLHAQFRNGRKRVLAAPWEVDAILARLEAKSLRLTDEDAALLRTHKAAASASPNPGRQATVARRGAATGTSLRAGA